MRVLVVVLALAIGCGCSFSASDGGVDKPPPDAAPDAPAKPPTSPRKLVFDATGIETNLVNVPVLVALTPAQIDYAQVANPATDLQFSDDAGPLDHEIEQWTPGGESIVWVRVPTLRARSTTDSITMRFGPSAGAPNPVMVWQPTMHELVTHMTPALANSASSDHAGTAINAIAAPGRAGAGLHFDAAMDHRLMFDNGGALFDGWAMFTLELWLRPDYATMDEVVGEPSVIDKGGGHTLGRVFKVGTPPTQSLRYQVDWTFPADTVRISTIIEPQAWNHVVYTFDGDKVRLYRDGAEVLYSDVSGARTLARSNAAFYLGATANAITGVVDELRVAQAPRSADWIRAQYKSMTGQLIRFTDP